jgi:hypothetical protein
VLNLLKKSRIPATIRPIAIAGAHKSREDEQAGGWVVPRMELVSTLQVLLQQRRLQVASSLREARQLVQELQRFAAKPKTTSSDTYDVWRERPNDDQVLSIAIAAWVGEHAMRRFFLVYWSAWRCRRAVR